MKRFVLIAIACALAGCGEGEDAKKNMTVVNSTWDQVRTKFAENGVAAADFYKAHAVRFSGVAIGIHQSIGYSGNVSISDGSSEPFLAAIELSEADKVKSLKAGQRITVVCYSVPMGITANDCLIETPEKTQANMSDEEKAMTSICTKQGQKKADEDRCRAKEATAKASLEKIKNVPQDVFTICTSDQYTGSYTATLICVEKQLAQKQGAMR